MSVNTKNWQELKKPSSLDVKSGADSKRKATFVAERSSADMARRSATRCSG